MVTRLLNAKNGEASSVCDRQKWVSRKLKSWTPKKAHGEKALQASRSNIKATVRNFWWTLAGRRTRWMIDLQACWDCLHQGWLDTTHTIVILKLRYFSSTVFVVFFPFFQARLGALTHMPWEIYLASIGWNQLCANPFGEGLGRKGTFIYLKVPHCSFKPPKTIQPNVCSWSWPQRWEWIHQEQRLALCTPVGGEHAHRHRGMRKRRRRKREHRLEEVWRFGML